MAVATIKDLRKLSTGLLREADILAFYLPGALSPSQISSLENCEWGVTVKEVSPPLPRYKKSEMFYSRSNRYAKGFTKSRSGFLDMCFWASNPRLEPSLDSYEYILRVDDDSEFIGDVGPILDQTVKSSINFASARTWSHTSDSIKDTREKLFEFLVNYCKRNAVIPKSKKLQMIIETGEEEHLHSLDWSVGNFNLYKNSIFSSSHWNHYIREVQEFGGSHRHRWGDIEIIGIFFYLYFGEAPKDLGLVDLGLYREKKEGSGYVGLNPHLAKLRHALAVGTWRQ